jgi:hypothetical protein
MLSSLSKARIERYSKFVGKFSDDFAIYCSLSDASVKQFYIVPLNSIYSDRIEPLAHISKRVDGKFFFKTYQPEKFSFSSSAVSLKEKITRRIAEIAC